MKRAHASLILLSLLLAAGAGCVRYTPRPVTAAAVLDDFEARRLNSPEFVAFLKMNADRDWPPAAWDLTALTLAAFYYHPDLDVARAQWATAQAGRITAGERPNPTGSILMGYNSTSPTSEVTPWIPEAALEIPIETAGKRGYRIAQAKNLSEAARLNILSAAWEVRSRLRQAYLELYSARETEALLGRLREAQAENVRILEAQLAIGEASPSDVTQARMALASSRLAALDAAQQSAQARVKLADAIGVPAAALDGAPLSFDSLLRPAADLPAVEIRRRALVNRADILSALAEYAAEDSALRLEIAKQYPDLSLGPGFQLDQTDAKWSLGLSLVLPLLNRNKGPIAEAEAKRAEAAARFQALQAKVLGEIESAAAAARLAGEKAKAADDLWRNLQKSEASTAARYQLGEISKLELIGLRIELAAGELARLEARIKARQAAGELEDAVQSPLDGDGWVLKTPDRPAGPVKERKDE
ncbi:MAG: TolC family protein [Candidatus Aminicenantes bacterium]|nr:TolC family protein [Candidatus Aminicenantes bacterium]